MIVETPVELGPRLDQGEWLDWKTKESLMARAPDDWLNGLRSKAERLILEPLIRKYAGRFQTQNLAALGAAATALRPNLASETPKFYSSMSELARKMGFFGDVPDYDFMSKIRSLFEAKPGQGYRADQNPHSFLVFVEAQIGWRAVKEGWAIAVAEDNTERGGGLFSWVDPARLSTLSDRGGIELPAALNMTDSLEIDERADREAGADRLWFVLTEDLDCENPSKPGPKTKEQDIYHNKVRAAARLALKGFPPPRLKIEDAAKVFANLGISEADADTIWDLVRPKNCEKKGRLSLKEGEARAAFLLEGGMAVLNESIREQLKK